MGRFIAQQPSRLAQIEGLRPGEGGQGVGGQDGLGLARQDPAQGIGADRQGLPQGKRDGEDADIHVERLSQPTDEIADGQWLTAGNVDRGEATITKSIKDNQEWIKRVMEANDLEAAGPFRIITTDFGAEKYAFDVAQPVRKKSGAAAAGDKNPHAKTSAAASCVATVSLAESSGAKPTSGQAMPISGSSQRMPRSLGG